MKDKGITDLFNKSVLLAINELLDDFILSDSNEDEIYNELKYINESIRTVLYLISIEKGFVYLSHRINEANERINIERTKMFISAVEKGEEKKYLSTLGKADKIALLNHLGINVSMNERKKLNKEELKYYTVISDSIRLSQNDDNRNGIEQFLTYRKNKA